MGTNFIRVRSIGDQKLSQWPRDMCVTAGSMLILGKSIFAPSDLRPLPHMPSVMQRLTVPLAYALGITIAWRAAHEHDFESDHGVEDEHWPCP